MGVFNLTPFVDLCPELAKRDITYLVCANHPVIADGKYVLFEMYCAEPACDCRQAMILVLRSGAALIKNQVVAAITFGWETGAFYQQWLEQVPHGDEAEADVWSGAHLLPGESHSREAQAFLAVFRLLIGNPENVNRYKQHYELFRAEHAARQTRFKSSGRIAWRTE